MALATWRLPSVICPCSVLSPPTIVDTNQDCVLVYIISKTHLNCPSYNPLYYSVPSSYFLLWSGLSGPSLANISRFPLAHKPLFACYWFLCISHWGLRFLCCWLVDCLLWYDWFHWSLLGHSLGHKRHTFLNCISQASLL